MAGEFPMWSQSWTAMGLLVLEAVGIWCGRKTAPGGGKGLRQHYAKRSAEPGRAACGPHKRGPRKPRSQLRGARLASTPCPLPAPLPGTMTRSLKVGGGRGGSAHATIASPTSPHPPSPRPYFPKAKQTPIAGACQIFTSSWRISSSRLDPKSFS